MNVIFLTVCGIDNISERAIYNDLLRKFRNEGHNVYIVTPSERKYGLPTSLTKIDSVNILRVKTLNIQKTNIFEKGLGTVLLETQFKNAVKKYLSEIKFDLILYSTPPITFQGVIKFLKSKNKNAVSYLLLKDIFPQNAVDLEMFSRKSLIYKYFRKKEIELYKISDYIGCMSPANVDFVLKHNTFLQKNKVEIAPNSLELFEDKTEMNKKEIRRQHNLPEDKTIFIYGGNLGEPQAIDFLLEVLQSNLSRTDMFFVIIGSGTEYKKVETWFKKFKPQNAKLLEYLPKAQYDLLIKACDVGLIFLDKRFTIPNFPCRLLSYLENKMPVLSATDKNTDIGEIAEINGFGYSCISDNVEIFNSKIDLFLKNNNIKEMGEKGYLFLKDNYLVENTYNAVMRHF